MTIKFLVVDDEPMVRMGIRLMLEEIDLTDVRVLEADGGDRAVEILKAEPVDILITDICMPDMDGIALAAWMNENMPGTDVVILSGYSEFEYAQKAIDYKVRSYLLKPVCRDRLYEVIDSLLREQRGGVISRASRENLIKLICLALISDGFSGIQEAVACFAGILAGVPEQERLEAVSRIFEEVQGRLLAQENISITLKAPTDGSDPNERWIERALEEGTAQYRDRKLRQKDGAFVRIRKWISESLDSEDSIEDIAREMGYNASYLGQLFRAETGTTISRYRNQMRMQRAKEMLVETKLNIIDIAQTVGYRDISYFTRLFRQMFGETPKDYRKIHSGGI